MQQLRELLDAAVDHTSFDLGRTERVGWRVQKPYVSRPDELISSEQLREILGRHSWHHEESDRARSALAITPDDLLSDMSAHVRMLFRGYIESSTDRIGHAFPIRDGPFTPTLAALAATRARPRRVRKQPLPPWERRRSAPGCGADAAQGSIAIDLDTQSCTVVRGGGSVKVSRGDAALTFTLDPILDWLVIDGTDGAPSGAAAVTFVTTPRATGRSWPARCPRSPPP